MAAVNASAAGMRRVHLYEDETLMKRCDTCRFYDNKVMPPDMSDKGLCRLNPPTFPSHNRDQLRCGEIPRYGWGDADWPIVTDDDWCGKWEELVWEVTKGPSK